MGAVKQPHKGRITRATSNRTQNARGGGQITAKGAAISVPLSILVCIKMDEINA